MHRATRILPFALTAAALARVAATPTAPPRGSSASASAADDRARADRGVGTGQAERHRTERSGCLRLRLPHVGTDTLRPIPATRPGSTACRSPPGERGQRIRAATDSAHITTYAYPPFPSPPTRPKTSSWSPTRSSPSWPPRRASRRCQATGSRSRRDELRRHTDRGCDRDEQPRGPGALQRGGAPNSTANATADDGVA